MERVTSMAGVNGSVGVPSEMVKVEPAARIVVELSPTGQISMTSTRPDPIYILGLLQMAQATVIRRATGEASLIEPARMIT